MLLSLRLTDPEMVALGLAIPTVTDCRALSTLAPTLVLTLLWVFKMAELAWILPMLVDEPAEIKLPARLAVAVALWVLPF